MQNVTRRSLAAGLVAGVAATTAIPALATPADAVDRLWRAYMAQIPQAKLLMVAQKEAERQMPHWAQSGPAYIVGDGSYAGDAVRWPLDLAVQPPGPPSHSTLCRPGPNDIEAAFARAARRHPESREWARANYRRHMRGLVERLRAQNSERARVGLPAIEAAYEANFDKRFDLVRKIDAMPPCPNSIAALILQGAMYMRKGAAADDIPGLSVLRHVQPHLSGLVKEQVDQLFQMDAYTLVDRLPYFV